VSGHPNVVKPTTVYVVDMVGLATTTGPVVVDNPVLGDHTYVSAPAAVNTVEAYLHIIVGVFTVTFGKGLMFTSLVTKHPVGSMYVNVATPADTPVNIPLVSTIVAIKGSFTLHNPPVVSFFRVSENPTHRFIGPVIAPGNGRTLIRKSISHPFELVKVIIAVPADTPVTCADTESIDATVAMVKSLDVHVPDNTDNGLLNITDEPTHTVSAPCIGGGRLLTVTVNTVKQPVGNV
jgi:hypothetical protein